MAITPKFKPGQLVKYDHPSNSLVGLVSLHSLLAVVASLCLYSSSGAMIGTLKNIYSKKI